MMRRLCSFLLLGVVVLAAGCSDVGDARRPIVPPPSGEPTWESSIRQLMADHCVTCHRNPPQQEAPEGFRFDKYDRFEGGDGWLGAYEYQVGIQLRVVEKGTMPPPPENPLSVEDRALLARWIELDAPRNDEDLRLADRARLVEPLR